MSRRELLGVEVTTTDGGGTSAHDQSLRDLRAQISEATTGQLTVRATWAAPSTSLVQHPRSSFHNCNTESSAIRHSFHTMQTHLGIGSELVPNKKMLCRPELYTSKAAFKKLVQISAAAACPHCLVHRGNTTRQRGNKP